LPEFTLESIEESLKELEQLLITAGGEVAAKIIQTREKPHTRTFIGPGKAKEIKDLAKQQNIGLIIFDSELTPSQQYNLEDIIDQRVIDRTALILDIFAQHAHSKEGKLQVELAQLNYLLPRIIGKGVELSRMGGGIGTRRGPGEQKLEVDRRHIRKRIQHLRSELNHVRQNRKVQRKKRKKAAVFSISLVGYTNAGKSTLLNSLTDAHVFVEDQLFATLDSTTRKLELPSHQQVVVSDTVGFIKKLPHQLVASFRSTLDEVREADLLLHVIDASHPQIKEQTEAVEIVLEEIGAAEKPRLSVFNKIDEVSEEQVDRLKKRYQDGIFISAIQGLGIDELVNKIDAITTKSMTRVELEISYTRGDLVEKIHRLGKVISEEHSPQGTKIIAEIPQTHLDEFKALAVKATKDIS